MQKRILFLAVLILTTVFTFILGNMIFSTELDAKNHEEKTHMVSLLEDRADPDIVIVNTGDQVQFNSRDGKEHNLTQGSGNAADEIHSHDAEGIESGIFKSDEAYKVQFKKRGIYSFHDHFNPDIYIRVIVKNKQ